MLKYSFNIIRLIDISNKEKKTNEEIDLLNRYLSLFEDFNKCTLKISKSEKQSLLRSVQLKAFRRQDIIFSKGDPLESFFIVLTGSVSHISLERGINTITTFTAGKQIGDKNYMKQQTRTTSCIASSDCVLLSIPQDLYKEILGEDAHILLHKKLKFIDAYFPGIKKYSFSHKERIAHILEVYTFKKGAILYKEREVPELVYFLCEGEAVLASDSYRTPIIKLTPGCCFGEEVFLGGINNYTSMITSDQAVFYAMKKNELMQYIPYETREAWRKNYLLKEQERHRLSRHVGLRLQLSQVRLNAAEFAMASPQAKKQLKNVKLREKLSTSHRDFRELNTFQESLRILGELRENARYMRPGTVLTSRL